MTSTKLNIIVFALIIIAGAFAAAPHFIQHKKAETVPELPSSYTLTERFPTFGDHVFDISGSGKHYGIIQQDVLSFGKRFDYLNTAGEKVATAHAKVFTLGAQIDVWDADGKTIGTIKEELFTSILGVTGKYRVLNEKGVQVAESEKFQLFGTSFTLRDATGHVLSRLERPAINIGGHKWDVSVKKASVVDSRVLVMIGAFKTAEDNGKSSSSSSSSSKK